MSSNQLINNPVPITLNDGEGFRIGYAEGVSDQFKFQVGATNHTFILTQQAGKEVHITHKMSGCRVESANSVVAAERKINELIRKHGAARVNDVLKKATDDRATTVAAANVALAGKKK